MNYPTHPTYGQIQTGCEEFAKTYDAPDLILGILRGGMINSVILSHFYGGTPIVAVDYSSKRGAGNDIGTSPIHRQELPTLTMGQKRVLIVDDICDSGYTLAEIVKAYESQGHVVDCYVSYLKESSVFLRTDRTWVIPKDSPWIVFPWERE